MSPGREGWGPGVDNGYETSASGHSKQPGDLRAGPRSSLWRVEIAGKRDFPAPDYGQCESMSEVILSSSGKTAKSSYSPSKDGVRRRGITNQPRVVHLSKYRF